jgi:hypothetical protein
MKNTVLVGLLMACILTSAAVYGAWAQAESLLGVKVGDNFTYSFEFIWRATDPSKVIPQEFSDMNQTISIHLNVTSVGGTTAFLDITRVMRDGTHTSTPGYIGVSSGLGVGALLFIIGANLTAGDKAYANSDAAAVAAGAAAEPFTITETITKTYLGSLKTVNHYSEKVTNATTGDYVNRDAYYDKETGVLLELTIEHYYASADEIDSEHWKIVQFNSAVAPADGTDNGTNGTSSSFLPSWVVPAVIVVVVVVVVALAAVVMLRRRGKAQGQAPTPSQTPPNPA